MIFLDFPTALHNQLSYILCEKCHFCSVLIKEKNGDALAGGWESKRIMFLMGDMNIFDL